MRLSILVGIAAAAALSLAPSTGAAKRLSAEARRGRAAMERAQCTRCHTVTDPSGRDRGIAAAPRRQHCVACHTWILGTKDDPKAIARYRETYPDWDRYLVNIVHFTKLPDLGTLTRRVRPEFVRDFLDAPYDLRPHLDESMVPVVMSAREKDAVVAYLSELAGAEHEAEPKREPVSAERVAAGRKAFENAGCPSCHLVGNIRFREDYSRKFYTDMKATALLAPNLRHVRDRMTRATLIRHVTDPKAVDPQATMPKPEVKAADIERIADFLLHVEIELDDAPKPLRAEDVPVLDRKVAYDEVFGKVFGQICVHCHMNADKNGGDGGPGNTGGLGWEGVKLDLETYDGMKRGLMRDGAWISVLDEGDDGAPPLLLQSLLRRHSEAAARDARGVYGDARIAKPPAGDRPGMPMGLPPLSVDDLSLIKTWLAQGAPGPRT